MKQILLKLSFVRKLFNEQLFSGKALTLLSLFLILSFDLQAQTQQRVSGVIKGELEEAIPGVSVLVKGTSKGVSTGADGRFIIDCKEGDILLISSIGYDPREVLIAKKQEPIDVQLKASTSSLYEVVVVGYGKQKRETVTGSIATITTKELTDVPVPTISQALVGKLAGITSRSGDGRPGAEISLQIRGLGTPLFVIDGVPSGEQQFNQMNPNDIESISILKDASAAIYGIRAADGVILVTTKTGGVGKNTVNVDTYYGVQSLTKYPSPASAADYIRASAEADVNQNGTSNITPEEVAKWAAGTEPGYQGYDWSQYTSKSAPQANLNLSTTGGSEKINYYVAVGHFNQDAVFEGYNFNRTSLQSNVNSKIGDRFTANIKINGKIETRDFRDLAGTDEYLQNLLGQFRNLPTDRPYANDNPDYPATNTNFATNNAVFPLAGSRQAQRKTLQTSFDLGYKFPVKGLTATAMYAFFYNNINIEYFSKSYDTYTYNKATSTYDVTGGLKTAVSGKEFGGITDNVMRVQLNYTNKIGKHDFGGLFAGEAQDRVDKYLTVSSQPTTNYISIINYFGELKGVSERRDESARLGLIFKGNYNYDNRYLVEVGGRYDGSWRFLPGKRFGLFPFVTAGWRASEESFLKGKFKALDNLKLRLSYGETAREPTTINPYAYLSGYNFGTAGSVFDGAVVPGVLPREMPITNFTWIASKMTNIGLDFSFWNGKLSGEVDVFYRKLTGLAAPRYDALIPKEVAIILPEENLNSNSNKGIEGSMRHASKIGNVNYSLGINATLVRKKKVETYKPRFGNSLDEYRTSVEDRYDELNWGYEAIGQFQSEEHVRNYPVDIDGKNNTSLLPGDIIFRDINNDGVINELDQVVLGPLAGLLPNLNFGFNGSAKYKAFDFSFVVSGGSLMTRGRGETLKKPFSDDGNSPDYMLNDRWHRENIFDVNSPWVAGTYPALKRTFNPSNDRASSFYFRNISYMRLKNIQVGYSLPAKTLSRLKISRARIYVNGFNLFTLDNYGFDIDPETTSSNGLDYPSVRVLNFGANITF